MDNLVPFYIDINWSIKKNKTKEKKKIIPQKTKTETSHVEQSFFLFDGLFLSGELIIGSQISDQLED